TSERLDLRMVAGFQEGHVADERAHVLELVASIVRCRRFNEPGAAIIDNFGYEGCRARRQLRRLGTGLRRTAEDWRRQYELLPCASASGAATRGLRVERSRIYITAGAGTHVYVLRHAAVGGGVGSRRRTFPL